MHCIANEILLYSYHNNESNKRILKTNECIHISILQQIYSFHDNNNDVYWADVKLFIDGSDMALNSVRYANNRTPILTDISPMYGSVLGGDEITFTG